MTLTVSDVCLFPKKPRGQHREQYGTNSCMVIGTDGSCLQGSPSLLERKRKPSMDHTHVVTRPDPAIPSRRFVAMRSSDVLKPAPGRQTCREVLTEPNHVHENRTAWAYQLRLQPK